MNSEQIDDILRRTMSDYRVSRGEKKLLASLTEEAGQDEQKLAFLRHRAFDIARQELMSPQAKDILGWLEDVTKALIPSSEVSLPDVEVCFSPGDSCVKSIVRHLDRTRRYADICVFTITDNRICEAIEEAHGRKVAVRIISDNEKALDLGSDIDRMRRKGIDVRVDNTRHHMHHKFAVFDGQRVLTGSYNWTRSAAEFNEENLIVMSDHRVVRAFGEQFADLWKQL